MKKTILYLVWALLAGTMLYQCENEKKTETTFSGRLVHYSECKYFNESTEGSETTSDTLSCVQYCYDLETGKLTLKHVNAGFNCCPGELFCSVSNTGDTIDIIESEESPMCDCNCLFDMDIEITGFMPGRYKVRFIEPYAEEMDKLWFEIDLVSKPEGSYCVTRKHYPWGQAGL